MRLILEIDDSELEESLTRFKAVVARLEDVERGLRMTNTALDTLATEFQADLTGTQALLAQNQAAITTLEANQADPAAIATLQQIHNQFAAILNPAPPETGTATGTGTQTTGTQTSATGTSATAPEAAQASPPPLTAAT